MAFFCRVIKAHLLKETLDEYKREKHLAITFSRGENVVDDSSSFTRKLAFRKKIWRRFRDGHMYRYLSRFRQNKSKENVCAKSFLGFFGGILLIYILFFFLTFGMRFPLRGATYICMISGAVCCLGLAFSRKIRCYVLLVIPVFFSKEGRRVLLAYAMYLSLTGPGKNTMQNMKILADAMTCGQEMIKRTLKQIVDMARAPFRSLKETLERIIKSLKEAVNKIKEFFDGIKRIILGILHVIKKAVSWLGSIVNFCNKTLGTPFQRCMKTFDDAIEDCKAKLGILAFLCHVVHVVKALCYTVKFLDLICLFTEFVSESIIGVVKKKLRDFELQIKNMFYVSIEYSHSYELHTEASNSTKMVAETILQKLVERFESMDRFISALSFVFSLVFLFIFFKVYYYKYKYMSSDTFDNYYISKYILDLDLRRAKMNRETVLPLEQREKKHYGKPTSLRLLRHEQENILKSLVVLSLSTFKFVAFMACDYTLFWVMFTIYQESHKKYTEVQVTDVGIHVSGKGSLAEFYRNMGKSLRVPSNPDLQIDPTQCLPDPIPPDYDTYVQIGYLVVLCWFFTITQPYGLRLRNVVLSHYYPGRARERAVWLYNHILRSRGSFLKYVRRQLRRKGRGAPPIERVTPWQRFMARNPLLLVLFRKKSENFCLLCGANGTKDQPLQKCKTPGCSGIYCNQCFSTLNNVCTMCQHPMEYGDISDISEERDSSEEEFYKTQKAKFAETNQKEVDEDGFSDEPIDNMTTIIFKDMETRPKFRDVEQHKTRDYAQSTDLLPTEAASSLHLTNIRKLKRAPETYTVIREKAKKVLSKMKKEKAERSRYAIRRKNNLMKAIKTRLQKQRRKLVQLGAEEQTDSDESSASKYERILKKAKILTKRLKKKKSKETEAKKLLLDSDNYGSETFPNRGTDKFENINYGKIKKMIISRVKNLKRKKAEKYHGGENVESHERTPLFPLEQYKRQYSHPLKEMTHNTNSIGGNEQPDYTDINDEDLENRNRKFDQILYVHFPHGINYKTFKERQSSRMYDRKSGNNYTVNNILQNAKLTNERTYNIEHGDGALL